MCFGLKLISSQFGTGSSEAWMPYQFLTFEQARKISVKSLAEELVDLKEWALNQILPAE